MIRNFIDWVHGWIVTLDIRFNNPELYRALTQPVLPEDLAEAPRPE